uniref:Reverse transcriptase domain-containing protein n=1 Tax=Nicotiana tabacum TaxID=4097 RepID=A0A1S4BQT1_TOBAC|nr:PREDICTED: uncharacterized protein LOC107810927 [Nicotiana tabacum]
MFKEQLGKTMKVYINVILVKSKKKEDHIDHLREAFDILRRHGMKLNLEKCAFGVTSRKFLGFLVSQRGIEVNPDQIKAIEGIPENLTSKKQVQKLTGRIAALLRFISRSSDRYHKFFGVLKKDNGLQWNSECIDALRKLKAYMSSPPLLAKAEPEECLPVYLIVSDVACHPISVVTTFPLRSILHKPELSGRLAKWAIELSKHDITYHPRTAIKSQVLADFVADFSAKIMPEVERETASTSVKIHDQWILYTDGSSNASGSGLGLTLEDGVLLLDKKEAKKLRMQAARYNIVNNDLYKRTFGSPPAKCLGLNQTLRVLEEVHEGHCGAHIGNRALVRCLVRACYYWPTVK